MAQYKRNFYGTSYYGKTNAYSGFYTTEEIISDESLNGNFTAEVLAKLPFATYKVGSEEIAISGPHGESGDYSVIQDPSNEIIFNATADEMIVHYQSRPDGRNVHIHVTSETEQGPVVNTYDFTSQSDSIAATSFKIAGLPFGQQLLKITLDEADGSDDQFYFDSIEARVTNFTVETRSKSDTDVWTEWEKIDVVYEERPTVTYGYKVTGESPSYAGNKIVQIKVWMASSDYEYSPEIEEITTHAGDTSNRTEDGLWRANIDMTNAAADLGVSFKELVDVKWISTDLTNNSISIRTRSSSDPSKSIWKPWSVPYGKSGKRVRLKEGMNQGYLITPLLNPADSNEFVRINQWMRWEDKSYFPEDRTDVKITYEFIDENEKVLHRIDDPKAVTDFSFQGSDIANRPFRIRIRLSRRFDKSSPVVDSLSAIASLIYEERKITEDFEFSAVDNSNSGERIVLDMSTLTFSPPAEASDLTYYLEDKTEKPLQISLYYESKRNIENVLSTESFTKLPTDKVWAKAKDYRRESNGDESGVRKHYQYGGGTALFQKNDKESMATAFTPLLDSSKKYRYFLLNGWYSAERKSIVEDSLNPNVNIYWETEQGLDITLKTQITEKSSHNAILAQGSDLSSDSIIGEVMESSTWGEVDWVSDEKIYFGSCNVNGLKDDYIRRHETPDSGDSMDIIYIVKLGETYESIASNFGVDPEDIRSLNNVNVTEQPIQGKSIIIPSKIVLPAIDPHVTLGQNPYEINIVANSVRQGAQIVEDERISTVGLEVIEKDVIIEKEEVIRGSVINGKDFLQNPLVSEIIGIWTLPDDVVIAPNYQEGLDYQLANGQIDWSLVSSNSREPNPGSKYYVTYKCKKPSAVKVTIGSDYQEESGIDRIWRSPEVKQFSGITQPGQDYKGTLPPMSEWLESDNPDVKDMEYMIEDNDLWVKTWIEFDENTNSYVAKGSLQDRIPKDNWFPTIRTGYYYLGKEERYLFSEPITHVPDNTQIPRGENVKYLQGKYKNAAFFESATENITLNSDFNISTQQSTVYWRGFNTQSTPTGQGVVELGK